MIIALKDDKYKLESLSNGIERVLFDLEYYDFLMGDAITFAGADDGNNFVFGSNVTLAANAGLTTVFGGNNSVGGIYNAVILGNNNEVNAPNGVVIGGGGKADNAGQIVQSYGTFNQIGDAQTSVMVLRKQTTDDTQTELALDGGTTYIKTEDDKSYNILVEVVAKDTATGDSAVFSSGDGCWFGVKRGTGFATTATIPTAPGTLSPGFADASLSGVALDFDVDTATDGHIKILVTGVAATTINWVARITMTEVGV